MLGDVRDHIVPLCSNGPDTPANMQWQTKEVRFTDRESYFVSEASVYRLLKAHDLITPGVHRDQSSR